VELLSVPAATILCPPHHWLIEGSNIRAGHQSWTCYRCGLIRPEQAVEVPRYNRVADIRRAADIRPARPLVPAAVPVAPDAVMGL
jgi:hypothetical protein